MLISFLFGIVIETINIPRNREREKKRVGSKNFINNLIILFEKISKRFDSISCENMINLHGENALKWENYSNDCISSSFLKIIGLD